MIQQAAWDIINVTLPQRTMVAAIDICRRMFNKMHPQSRMRPPRAEGQRAIEASPDTDRFIDLHEVKWLAGLGKTTIYHLISAGEFPAPIKLSGTASRWSLQEVQEWQANCRINTRNSRQK